MESENSKLFYFYNLGLDVIFSKIMYFSKSTIDTQMSASWLTLMQEFLYKVP